MQDKFEFDNLPAEIKLEIANHLFQSDLFRIASTSKYHLSLFKPQLNVVKFSYYLMSENYPLATMMLNKDSNLIFKKANVADKEGRLFFNISGFEYLSWSLDECGVELILSSLPKDKQKQKYILEKLLAQWIDLKTKGISYWYHKKITESYCYNREALIKKARLEIPRDYRYERGHGCDLEYQSYMRKIHESGVLFFTKLLGPKLENLIHNVTYPKISLV